MRCPRFILLLLVSAFWTAESAVAQSQVAVLEGTVRELDGGPLAEVGIRARRIETNELFVRKTDAAGVYGWDGLPVGDYEVLASKDRFDSQRRVPVRLQVGQRVRLDFRLRRTRPGEDSKISEDLSRLTVERDDVGQLIDRKQLRNLPSKERNFRDLVTLAPGAVAQGTRRIQVLGMSWRDNLTYFDGTLITGGDGSSSLTPSSEAIREFDVKTGLYSAQYGIRSGGQVLLVTRHGGNRFRGGLFWFHRNDNLDARNYFEQRKAEFKRNQMGGTLGGPLILPGLNRDRDRAWFFLSYLHYTIRETLPLTAVVPTPEEREGRFSGSILDPLTGKPFPGNRIPAHRIDPVARQLLSFYPDPNTVGPLNFTSPDSKRPHDNRQLIARIDVRTSSSSSWAFRFSGDRRPSSRPSVFSVFSTRMPLGSYSQAITNTRRLSAGSVNYFGLHWFRRPYTATVVRPKTDAVRRLGIPQLLETEIDRDGIPLVSIQGYTRLGDIQRTGPVNIGNWQVKDDLAIQHGPHSFQMGVEFRQNYNLFGLQGRSHFRFLRSLHRKRARRLSPGIPVQDPSGGRGTPGQLSPEQRLQLSAGPLAHHAKSVPDLGPPARMEISVAGQAGIHGKLRSCLRRTVSSSPGPGTGAMGNGPLSSEFSAGGVAALGGAAASAGTGAAARAVLGAPPGIRALFQ